VCVLAGSSKLSLKASLGHPKLITGIIRNSAVSL
jgi:hypothetical protein